MTSTNVFTSPVSAAKADGFQRRLEEEDNINYISNDVVEFNRTTEDPVPVVGRVEHGRVVDLQYQDSADVL